MEHGNCTWRLANSFEELKGFYDEIGTFLFLVGTKISLDGTRYYEHKFLKFSEHQDGKSKVSVCKLPQLALIPGESVMKFFENTEGSIDLHISPRKLMQKGYESWNCYFGETKIHETLFIT